MRVLALDTTTRAGSVAIVDDDRVLFEQAGDSSRSHAERLPGDLLAALAHAQLRARDIDLFAVASGPGSFTGLRIGIATMQGLAFVNSARVAPVSALLALGHGGSLDLPDGALVGAWMDAHRRDVFSTLYRVTSGTPFAVDRLVEIEPAAVGDPASVWARWTGHFGMPAVIIGDGALLYAHVPDRPVRMLPPPLLAPVIWRIAVTHAQQGDIVPPAAVQPLYVRRPDAEIHREKRTVRNSR